MTNWRTSCCDWLSACTCSRAPLRDLCLRERWTTPTPILVDLLDGIDGAYERAQLGLQDAQAGRSVVLDEL